MRLEDDVRVEDNYRKELDILATLDENQIMDYLLSYSEKEIMHLYFYSMFSGCDDLAGKISRVNHAIKKKSVYDFRQSVIDGDVSTFLSNMSLQDMVSLKSNINYFIISDRISGMEDSIYILNKSIDESYQQIIHDERKDKSSTEFIKGKSIKKTSINESL